MPRLLTVLLGLLLATSQAASAAASCAAEWPEPAVSFHIDEKSGKAEVGVPMTFAWRVAATAPHDASVPQVAAYLVLLAPEATRFEGRGFYALTPNARGPFDIAFGKDRVRAVVPLTTRFAQLAGAIDVVAYQAGEMDIEWAIVQAADCGEKISRFSGKRTVDVLPGTPKLVARDEFAIVTPDVEIVPAEGPYRARVYGRSVEVSNRVTGEVVLQTTGQEPIFSPTGRFLSVSTDEAQISDIFDLLAERRVGRFQSFGMYWSHADSFLYLDQEFGGGMQIVRMLHGRRHAIEEAPEIALLTGFREEGAEAPEHPIHAGLDPDAEDIDPGDGGFSFTQGIEAWNLQMSLEAGVAAFAVGIRDDEGMAPDDEVRGLVIDLGMKSPMIETTRRAELDALLRSDFNVREPKVSGWNTGGLHRTYEYENSDVYRTLRRADDDEEAKEAGKAEEAAEEIVDTQLVEREPFVAFSEAPTQSILRGGAAADLPVPAAGTRVRSAVALIDRDPAVADDGIAALGFRMGDPVRILRSGIDDVGLRAVSAKLARLYDPRVAKFGSWPDNQDGGYGTLAFPQPVPEELPVEPELLDITLPGRDTWAWSGGRGDFWLTQTIETGRLGHHFTFTLLGQHQGVLRHADLLAVPQTGAAPGFSPEALDLSQRGDMRFSLAGAFSEPSLVFRAGERYLLVATRPVVRLVVFDLQGWAPVCVVAAPYSQAAIQSLALSSDARHLLQLNRSGAVEVYSCKDGERVLSGMLADGELVVMDKHGYFDGSEDAAAYVQLKIPGIPGRQLLSQFGSRLRMPGLANAVLRGGWQPSRLEMVVPPTVSVSASGADGALRVTARSPRGLRSLQVFAGGRRVEHADLVGADASVDIVADELFSEGIVTVVATDADGITSAPLELLRETAGARPSGRLYGLTIGVDKYPGMPGSDLKYAAADARRIAGVVAESHRYESVEMASLIDGQVTPDTLRARLREIVGAAAAEDTILLSFAGHGLMAGSGGLRLALPQTEAADIENTSFDFDEIGAIVRMAKARVVILLDVCHAGASGRAGIASNDDVVRQLSTQSGSGIVLLSASKGRQLSQESASFGGGLFSVAFERALGPDRSAADLDGNGRISLAELYRTVKATVVAETAGSQTPWLSRNQVFGDFDLF